MADNGIGESAATSLTPGWPGRGAGGGRYIRRHRPSSQATGVLHQRAVGVYHQRSNPSSECLSKERRNDVFLVILMNVSFSSAEVWLNFWGDLDLYCCYWLGSFWNIIHWIWFDNCCNSACNMFVHYTSHDLSLQWRHNERDGVSNHQPYDCLLNRLFSHKSKKISKLRVTGLCEGNSPVTGEFPAQRISNAAMFLFDDVIMYTRFVFLWVIVFFCWFILQMPFRIDCRELTRCGQCQLSNHEDYSNI